MQFGIGQPVTRKEDVRFLTGRGRYVADIDFVRQACAVFVFSTHAHALIRGIDKTVAERASGAPARTGRLTGSVRSTPRRWPRIWAGPRATEQAARLWRKDASATSANASR